MLTIEHCRPLLEAQQCATGMLSSDDCDMSLFDPEKAAMMQKAITAGNITLNYICRDHVEGYSYCWFLTEFFYFDKKT